MIDLRSMRMMHMCCTQVVRESMRMFPVSASGLGRCTTGPTVLGRYMVPAGAQVQVIALVHIANTTAYIRTQRDLS